MYREPESPATRPPLFLPKQPPRLSQAVKLSLANWMPTVYLPLLGPGASASFLDDRWFGLSPHSLGVKLAVPLLLGT